MRGRYYCALLMAGLLAGCGSSSTSASSQPGPVSTPASAQQIARCTPRRASVLAVSHEAVVYGVRRLIRGGPGPGARTPGVAIFGCAVGVWRRVEIGTAVNLRKAALNATTLAYATSQVQGIDTISTQIVVADVRSGRQLFAVAAGRIAIAPHSVSVDALAVAPGGTVAWIQHGGTTESPGYSVHAASVAKPADHQLASGPAIDPRTLAVTQTTVSWVAGGRPQSASI